MIVADALRRAEPKTFAATDDPWTLDRHLRDERAHHADIIVSRPPDARRDLDNARRRLARSEDEYQSARAGLAYREAERERLGPLTLLRRGGREDSPEPTKPSAAPSSASPVRTTHSNKRAPNSTATTDTVDARSRWDREHAWRVDRVAELDDTLAHHWANVVLRVVRADDPLAFGVQRLRDARTTYHRDHQRIIDALPPDRRDALTRAQADRGRCQQGGTTPNNASARHGWPSNRPGRLAGDDETPPTPRAPTPSYAPQRYPSQPRATPHSRPNTASPKQQRGTATHSEAVAKTATQRNRLAGAIHDLDTALELTRPERVAAAATNPSSDLWRILGPPPATRGGLAAWCGIAEHIEAQNDLGVTAITLGREVGSPALHARIHELLHPADPLSSLTMRKPSSSGPADATPGQQANLSMTVALWQQSIESASRALRNRSRDIETSAGLELQ